MLNICRDISRRFLGPMAALALISAITVPARADDPPYYSPGGVALSGYDAVAYFHQGTAQRGSSAHSVVWHGVTWYFTDEDSLTAFEMNPTAYEPAFGGYCAYSVSLGKHMSGDPLAFAIVDDTLVLFHNPGVLAKASDDMTAVLAKASANWPAVLDH
ncbi:MAG: YHS domain-containing (seleno)protein [Paracoccaceae bacterium]